MAENINPDKIKTTKTYSISLGDINRLKEMSESEGVTDAEVLHRAVNSLYNKMFFPTSDEKAVRNEEQ